MWPLQSYMIKERSDSGVSGPLSTETLEDGLPLSTAPRELLTSQQRSQWQAWGTVCPGHRAPGHSRPGIQCFLLSMCVRYSTLCSQDAVSHSAPWVSCALITTCFSYRLLRLGTAWSACTLVTSCLGNSVLGPHMP